MWRALTCGLFLIFSSLGAGSVLAEESEDEIVYAILEVQSATLRQMTTAEWDEHNREIQEKKDAAALKGEELIIASHACGYQILEFYVAESSHDLSETINYTWPIGWDCTGGDIYRPREYYFGIRENGEWWDEHFYRIFFSENDDWVLLLDQSDVDDLIDDGLFPRHIKAKTYDTPVHTENAFNSYDIRVREEVENDDNLIIMDDHYNDLTVFFKQGVPVGLFFPEFAVSD